MNRTSSHRHRLAAALALGAWLALTACVEAPPTASDSPDDTAGSNLIPVTPVQLAATLGDGFGLVLETRVVGSDGRPLRSAVVHFDVVSGDGFFTSDSTLTNDQGFTQVVFVPLSAGTVLVQARSGEDTITFAIEVASDPNQGATFLKVGGDGQSATVGAILPQPFTVQVRNPDGLPVDSIPVTFTIQFAQGDSAKLADDPSAFEDGGHQIVVETDAAGFARAWLRLGTLAGGHTVSATALVVFGRSGERSVTRQLAPQLPPSLAKATRSKPQNESVDRATPSKPMLKSNVPPCNSTRGRREIVSESP